MNSPNPARIAGNTFGASVRHPLACAVATALIAFAPQAFAVDVEQDARASLQAVTERLPELGSESSKKEGESTAPLAQTALGTLMSVANGGTTDSIVSGVVNDGLKRGLNAIDATDLPFLGNLQGGIQYDNATGKWTYDVLTVDAFLGDGKTGHNLLGQFGVHNQADRPTANIGAIYRWINPSQRLLLGANVFYDRDLKTGTDRVGLGAEAMTRNLRAFSNLYAPLGDDWSVSRKDDQLEERPASGFDLGLAYTPSRLPGLDLQLTGSRWNGDQVDVFGSGTTESDPTVYAAKIGYTPIPLISATLEHARTSGDQEDTSVGLRFNYQFGVPLAQQLDPARNNQRTSIPFKVMAPVERQKRIVMETRDRYAQAPMFAGPMLVREEILEGVDYVSALAVTGGAPTLSYALSGVDAALFQLNGAQLRLAARDYGTPTDTDGDNVYEVTVTVTDARGRQAQKQFQVVVTEDVTDQEIPGVASPITHVAVHLGGVALQGHPIVGEPLSANVTCEQACDSRTLQFQWEIETAPGSGTFAPIAGANAETYTPVAGDQLRAIRVSAWY